jgi:predicted GNAT superfamily acetyltransferase
VASGKAAGGTGVTRGITNATASPVEIVANDIVTMGAITIRKCETLADMEACFELQKEVWKFSDADLIPVRLFVVADKIGGQVIGAFVTKNDPSKSSSSDVTELVGFALAIPGVRNGHAYLHSQMLAVRQQYRNAGVGRRMKLYQREDALARGFELMEWTFDPLEIKNAYLNIVKLGALARRYNVNQYGITSSPLQGGLPSDRLIAEWWMKSKRVQAVLTGAPPANFECRVRIDVPSEIHAWKDSPATRGRALALEENNRQQFTQAFAEGLNVLGYERDGRGDGHFLLGEWDERWSY